MKNSKGTFPSLKVFPCQKFLQVVPLLDNRYRHTALFHNSNLLAVSHILDTSSPDCHKYQTLKPQVSPYTQVVSHTMIRYVTLLYLHSLLFSSLQTTSKSVNQMEVQPMDTTPAAQVGVSPQVTNQTPQGQEGGVQPPVGQEAPRKLKPFEFKQMQAETCKIMVKQLCPTIAEEAMDKLHICDLRRLAEILQADIRQKAEDKNLVAFIRRGQKLLGKGSRNQRKAPASKAKAHPYKIGRKEPLVKPTYGGRPPVASAHHQYFWQDPNKAIAGPSRPDTSKRADSSSAKLKPTDAAATPASVLMPPPQSTKPLGGNLKRTRESNSSSSSSGSPSTTQQKKRGRQDEEQFAVAFRLLMGYKESPNEPIPVEAFPDYHACLQAIL